MPEEGRTRFRKYAATVVAAITILSVVGGALSGVLVTPIEGLAGGIIIGLAAKYLWEEQGQ